MTQMPKEGSRKIRAIVGLMLFGFFLFRIDLFYGLLTRFFGILSAFIVGILMALLINIPLEILEGALSRLDRRPRFIRLKRGIALTLSVLLVAVVVALLALVIIPEVVTAVESLVNRLPYLITQLEGLLSGYNISLRQLVGLGSTDADNVQQAVQRVYNFLWGGLSYSSNVVMSGAQVVINVFVGLIFAIYLLFSKERIKGQIKSVLEAFLLPRYARYIEHVMSITIESYSRFLGGQVLQALISAVIIWLVMLVFGFPLAVLIALLTFVCAFIPIFGPFIAGILAALMMLTVAPARVLWFLLAYFVAQQLEGSVIYPRILSSAIDMPSIWVLLAVTVGGGIMGITGMLLFVPLTAVLYRLLSDATKRRNTEQAVGKTNV